ncbi:unnamed protein product [Caenorhabditis angaria]|uniref:Uncharacterized protein n=1 Tax=Caenorhabditis angaria TaxID=860376 RepID=A0A9P1N3Q2_9PELO|nr:unnamed protein product [Caenorhabditis angaria]
MSPSLRNHPNTNVTRNIVGRDLITTIKIDCDCFESYEVRRIGHQVLVIGRNPIGGQSDGQNHQEDIGGVDDDVEEDGRGSDLDLDQLDAENSADLFADFRAANLEEWREAEIEAKEAEEEEMERQNIQAAEEFGEDQEEAGEEEDDDGDDEEEAGEEDEAEGDEEDDLGEAEAEGEAGDVRGADQGGFEIEDEAEVEGEAGEEEEDEDVRGADLGEAGVHQGEAEEDIEEDEEEAEEEEEDEEDIEEDEDDRGDDRGGFGMMAGDVRGADLEDVFGGDQEEAGAEGEEEAEDEDEEENEEDVEEEEDDEEDDQEEDEDDGDEEGEAEEEEEEEDEPGNGVAPIAPLRIPMRVAVSAYNATLNYAAAPAPQRRANRKRAADNRGPPPPPITIQEAWFVVNSAGDVQDVLMELQDRLLATDYGLMHDEFSSRLFRLLGAFRRARTPPVGQRLQQLWLATLTLKAAMGVE